MPCSDTMMADNQGEDSDLISHLDDHSHNHNHGDEEDDCPPFCACQCCGIHVLAPHRATLDKKEPKANDTYTIHYTFNYSYQFLGGIWHPPAVS